MVLIKSLCYQISFCQKIYTYDMQSPCSFSVECYCPPRRNLYIGLVEGPFSLEFIANWAEKFSLAPTPVHLQTGLWGLRVSHFFGGKGENLFPLEEFISRSSINPWVKVYASKHVLSCWFIVAIFFFFPPVFTFTLFPHSKRKATISLLSGVCL